MLRDFFTTTPVDPWPTGNTPDPADIEGASIERTEHAGDGPDVQPIYGAPRPLIDETHVAAIAAAVRSVLLDPPAPAALSAYRVARSAADCGISVQAVPPSVGRRRKVRIVAVSGAAYLAGERRDSGSATTGDTTGFVLAASSGELSALETETSAPIYASGTGAYDLAVLIETY